MSFVLPRRLCALGSIAAAAFAAMGLGAAGAGAATFSYTGGSVTWEVPDGITHIQADAFGADGGATRSTSGGLDEFLRPVYRGGEGAGAHAIIPVTAGETLTINVGGKGEPGGGSNGGGQAGSGTRDHANGGGGASDVRRGSARLIVAGGGGGASDDAVGGDAWLPGQSTFEAAGAGGGGATAISGGSGGAAGWNSCSSSQAGEGGWLGQGGAGGDSSGSFPWVAVGGGGGGGGYYGGGGGGGGCYSGGGGGGGSSFVSASATSVSAPGAHTPLPGEHGSVTIIPISAPEEPGSCPLDKVGVPPACVNLPPSVGTGQQVSNSCTDEDADVVDGFAGSTYVSLRIQDNPANPDVLWVCYRAWNAGGSVNLGGRVSVDQDAAASSVPVVETTSSGCSVTPINTTVGDPGDPSYGPYVIGVNSTSSEARACFKVGSFERRVTVQLPSSGGAATIQHDPPSVPDPPERPGNPAHPSTTCQSTPGHTRLANLESGDSWISVYSAAGGPGETRLCVRAEGVVSHGGMLTLKSTTGISPVVEGPVSTTEPSPCTSNVITNDADPARYSIRRSPGTNNPASICVAVGSSGQFGPPGQRFTLGTSGSATAPVVWTPDLGTPG